MVEWTVQWDLILIVAGICLEAFIYMSALCGISPMTHWPVPFSISHLHSISMEDGVGRRSISICKVRLLTQSEMADGPEHRHEL